MTSIVNPEVFAPLMSVELKTEVVKSYNKLASEGYDNNDFLKLHDIFNALDFPTFKELSLSFLFNPRFKKYENSSHFKGLKYSEKHHIFHMDTVKNYSLEQRYFDHIKRNVALVNSIINNYGFDEIANILNHNHYRANIFVDYFVGLINNETGLYINSDYIIMYNQPKESVNSTTISTKLLEHSYNVFSRLYISYMKFVYKFIKYTSATFRQIPGKKVEGDIQVEFYKNIKLVNAAVAKNVYNYNDNNSVKITKAVRAFFPKESISDGTVERLSLYLDSVYADVNTDRIKVHMGLTEDHFEYATTLPPKPTSFGQTDNMCKAQANSCMRHNKETHNTSHHPSTAYASGDFMVVYITTSDEEFDKGVNLLSRCYVAIKDDNLIMLPFYGASENMNMVLLDKLIVYAKNNNFKLLSALYSSNLVSKIGVENCGTKKAVELLDGLKMNRLNDTRIKNTLIFPYVDSSLYLDYANEEETQFVLRTGSMSSSNPFDKDQLIEYTKNNNTKNTVNKITSLSHRLGTYKALGLPKVEFDENKLLDLALEENLIEANSYKKLKEARLLEGAFSGSFNSILPKKEFSLNINIPEGTLTDLAISKMSKWTDLNSYPVTTFSNVRYDIEEESYLNDIFCLYGNSSFDSSTSAYFDSSTSAYQFEANAVQAFGKDFSEPILNKYFGINNNVKSLIKYLPCEKDCNVPVKNKVSFNKIYDNNKQKDLPTHSSHLNNVIYEGNKYVKLSSSSWVNFDDVDKLHLVYNYCYDKEPVYIFDENVYEDFVFCFRSNSSFDFSKPDFRETSINGLISNRVFEKYKDNFYKTKYLLTITTKKGIVVFQKPTYRLSSFGDITDYVEVSFDKTMFAGNSSLYEFSLTKMNSVISTTENVIEEEDDVEVVQDMGENLIPIAQGTVGDAAVINDIGMYHVQSTGRILRNQAPSDDVYGTMVSARPIPQYPIPPIAPNFVTVGEILDDPFYSLEGLE